MARPEELYPGNRYFLVNFHDGNLLFPAIYTLTYLECEEDLEGHRSWLFEDPPHSSDPDAVESPEDEPSVTAFSDDQLYRILDFSGLIKVLGEVAADHPIHPLPGRNWGPATAAQFGAMRREITTFLEKSEYLALTITILFTDDALSIGRSRGDGYHMSFFPHPRREPQKEVKIRALFESLGNSPSTDYLSDHGRTRMLDFPIPGDLEAILQLCGRVLSEVHGMRDTDSLRYSFSSSSDIEQPTV
jgi:hypothetical protein